MGFVDSIKSTLQEAWSGNLSQYDKNTIVDNAKQSIAQAAAGADPGTIASLQSQVEADINASLNGFGLPGETGSSIGAQPTSTPRVGTEQLNLGNISDNISSAEKWLKYIVIVGAGAAAIFFGFPYIAPGIAANIRAARTVRRG